MHDTVACTVCMTTVACTVYRAAGETAVWNEFPLGCLSHMTAFY
jgi:hypothetical protein